ncbi:MAG: DNA mismatch repair protein MutS [Gammaproteobacteria bacterium]|nr:MAG: DNA mismatch repair protein MutS [Gammaproteobacteria bacterium]RLA32491.1 MAG: DNA mismatch repair protein MutS [Gammaproteobacteria bacterium]
MADRDNKKQLDKRPASDEEAGLFRRAMNDTKPLQHSKKEPTRRPSAPARARFSRQDEHEVLRDSMLADIDDSETASGDSLRFYRASVGKRTMRKLARGNFSVQNEIDLHGMIISQAKETLHDFIVASSRRGHTCVRIIHGKGLGSGERGPVLKRKVNSWLRQWGQVLAFVSARQVDGGTGAVYVLLQED